MLNLKTAEEARNELEAIVEAEIKKAQEENREDISFKGMLPSFIRTQLTDLGYLPEYNSRTGKTYMKVF